MVFGFDPEVLENRIGPKSFHMIPVLNLSVTDGIVETVTRARGSRYRLVADEEIQVLGAALGREVAGGTCATRQERRLVRNSRPT